MTADSMPNVDSEPNIKYARSLYDDVVYWYRSADNKAQVLLTLIGLFVAFLTGSVFIKTEDIKSIADCLDERIWLVLMAMAITITLSVFAALACLWSRIFLTDETRKELEIIGIYPKHPIPGRIVGYFSTLWRIPLERFDDILMGLSVEDEVKI